MGGDPPVNTFEGFEYGLDRAQRRMNDIQSRMASVNGPSFAATMEAEIGATSKMPLVPAGFELTGAIGSGGSSGNEEAYRSLATQAATRHNIDPLLFRALVQQESAWNSSAVSSKGAQGLCQLMPDTARELGVTDPNDPEQSLDAGARYLRQLLDKFERPDLALAAYNFGQGNVAKTPATEWPVETKNYVRNIMARWQQLGR